MSQPSPQLPPLGNNPSTHGTGTTPGSFANPSRIGTPWTFSSPDTPGMPQPSDKTAWDFMPDDWTFEDSGSGNADGTWTPPAGFEPSTQLEHARLGTITPQMVRVAEREPHLTPEQVRDEIAARREVHDRVGAPALGPAQLLDLFVGAGRDGRGAHVRVDLGLGRAADRHRVELHRQVLLVGGVQVEASLVHTADF